MASPSEGAPYLVDVAIEGATDRFMGRPLSSNPYNAALCLQEWASWRHGWEFAGWLLELRAAAETRRWLNEDAAA